MARDGRRDSVNGQLFAAHRRSLDIGRQAAVRRSDEAAANGARGIISSHCSEDNCVKKEEAQVLGWQREIGRERWEQWT